MISSFFHSLQQHLFGVGQMAAPRRAGSLNLPVPSGLQRRTGRPFVCQSLRSRAELAPATGLADLGTIFEAVPLSHNRVCREDNLIDDPSAGSPTETLLRLLPGSSHCD